MELGRRPCNQACTSPFFDNLEEFDFAGSGEQPEDIIKDVQSYSDEGASPGDQKASQLDEVVAEEPRHKAIEYRSDWIGDDDEIYSIYKVIARRELQGGTIEYRVEWIRYPDEEDYSWQLASKVRSNVPGMVKAFEKKQLKARRQRER